MSPEFSYELAFSRNLGWVTEAEQQLLRRKTVAIAGMGGVGGSHLLTLTRLGIGHFRIADFDRFSLVNFNRQAGAMMSTLDEFKVDALTKAARDINPEVQIEPYPDGVTPANMSRFLSGADVYVDGLDFFAFSARQLAFAECARLALPAITAAPLGMGAAQLNFLPGQMTFEDYFQWGDLPEPEKALRFVLGLSPRLLQDYLADETRLDMTQRRAPSTVMGCQLCAGMAAATVLKLLVGRGKVIGAPHGLHFDAYRNRMVKTWRPWGNRNPIQRLMLFVARRRLAQMEGKASR